MADARVFDGTVLIVGGGAMGGSIARGLVSSGALAPSQVLVADPSPSVREALVADAGVTTFPDASEALALDPQVVLFAVKPQVLDAVVAPVADQVGDRLVVSIAAGVPLAHLQELVGATARVVRVMPNLPVAVRKGAGAIAPGENATAQDASLVRALLSSLGSAAVMREDQLDVEGAVVGCGPAFFALMVDALTRAGVEAGLPAATCRDLVRETMGGVAEMLADGTHPRAFMERVTSPGGTTAAALRAMEPLLQEACYEAVDAAMAKTYELAEGCR